MDGSAYERAFARLLDEQGYHVIRAPSSGSATKRDLPDLAFAYNGRIWAVEMKAISGNIAYYNESEVDALQSFAEAFGAVSRLCARYKGDTSFYLYDAWNARRTDTGRYAVDRDIDPDMVIEP